MGMIGIYYGLAAGARATCSKASLTSSALIISHRAQSLLAKIACAITWSECKRGSANTTSILSPTLSSFPTSSQTSTLNSTKQRTKQSERPAGSPPHRTPVWRRPRAPPGSQGLISQVSPLRLTEEVSVALSIIVATLASSSASMQSGSSPLWIIKPASSSRGRGIYLIDDVSEVPIDETCVVSRYVANPFLINGLKFDLRIYVLVTSMDPLRIYVFNEGLTRFASEPYK